MKAPLPFLPLTLAALLILRPGISSGAVQAPAFIDARAESKQGLTLTLKVGEKSDARSARLVALCVPAGQPVSPFLAASPFQAHWDAEITSELRSEYTFAADVTGQFRISLNGVIILEGDSRDGLTRVTGKPVQLNKGANKLAVDFQSPEKKDAVFRMLWSSREFPWEPVPPAVFQHDASAKELRNGDRIREGRLLFAQNHCSACHDAAALLPPKGEGMPELAQDAPVFDEVGGKYREAWLAAWINDPHSIRPHALMPKLFSSEEGKVDQRAADIAAYLASVGAPKEGKPFDEALVPQGGALFANLGCIACHTKPDAEGNDELDRIPLSHVKAKWQAPALIAYLKDPAKNYAWNRMPHFRLNDTEAEQLAAYLISTANREFPAGPAGDIARGAQLMATAGCLNCHAGVPPTTTPTLAATLESGWLKGCLAADSASRGKAPDFAFTVSQREALLAFASSGFESLKTDSSNEFAERQIRNLRCTACHARDGEPSVWSKLDEEVTALQSGAPLEEGEGKPIFTTALPLLTWFGEKLQPAWMANFIAGHGAYKPRPWLIARMPGFSAPAESLAKGLSLQHGFPLTPSPETPVDPQKVKAGETLIGENGGFNCLQCHALGERPATAVFEAPAPNLAYAHERIRKEYYQRWTLFPLRIDPETKMPRFADDEGKTPLTDFFGGNAAEQFDAIWQYLQTVKKP